MGEEQEPGESEENAAQDGEKEGGNDGGDVQEVAEASPDEQVIVEETKADFEEKKIPSQLIFEDDNEGEPEPDLEFQLELEDPKAFAKKGKPKDDKSKKTEKPKKKENVAPKKEKKEKPPAKEKKKGGKSKKSSSLEDDQLHYSESVRGSIIKSPSLRKSLRPSLFFQDNESLRSRVSSITGERSMETIGSYSTTSSSYLQLTSKTAIKPEKSKEKKRKKERVSTMSQVSVGKKKGKGKKKDVEKKVVEEVKSTEESEAANRDLGAAAQEEVVKEPPPKKPKKPKKGKGKDLTASELRRLEEERRKQEEEQAAREAEALKSTLIANRRMAIEKEKREIVEQHLRAEQLEATKEFVDEIKNAGCEAYTADKVKEEWEKYLTCDGRPDPENVPQMNTYLHLWENEFEALTSELAVYRTNEMYNLLEKLQDAIDDPFEVTESKQNDWIWIRSRFRKLQMDNLNFCTYRLIRNIDERLNRIDIPTADFRLKEQNFSLCLWIPVQLPIPVPNPRNPSRPRVHLDWPEMSMNVLFPNSLDCERLALRGMYVTYNHLSDTSASFADPAIPEVLAESLAEKTANEWRVKLRYKYDNRVLPREQTQGTNEDGEAVIAAAKPEQQALTPDELAPTVPYQKLDPTASQYALANEDRAIEDARNAMRVNLPDKVINLRKYVILGGVYYLDLFLQPTQPQEMVSFEIFITNLIVPCRIEKAPFYVEYRPPPPPAPGVRRTPEEIEEELIKQEKEFEKLILVTIVLPTHILWMDVPQICQWNEETREWTTADVHDFKHIEEKGYVTFRTGKLGAFGIATYKYPNFPFQAWELRPEWDGTVSVQITAAILFIEFHVKNHMVCLSQLQNAPHCGMDQHLNVYYKLPKLIRIMREAGVDVFPAFDTFFYVEGTCEKYWPMEMQTYYGMAMTATAYNYSWSRWNMTSDYRTIVMQARHYKFDKPKQMNFNTCLITPLKATMIDCTEVSPAFSDEPIEGMKFYADMYQLIKGTAHMSAKERLAESDLAMVDALSKLLIATRFLSFS